MSWARNIGLIPTNSNNYSRIIKIKKIYYLFGFLLLSRKSTPGVKCRTRI